MKKKCKDNPNVQIILVNYKSADDTIECLKSLQKITYSNVEIIVVNNYASDYDKLDRFIKNLEKKWKFFDKITKTLAYIQNTGIISRKIKYLCSG